MANWWDIINPWTWTPQPQQKPVEPEPLKPIQLPAPFVANPPTQYVPKPITVPEWQQPTWKPATLPAPFQKPVPAITPPQKIYSPQPGIMGLLANVQTDRKPASKDVPTFDISPVKSEIPPVRVVPKSAQVIPERTPTMWIPAGLKNWGVDKLGVVAPIPATAKKEQVPGYLGGRPSYLQTPKPAEPEKRPSPDDMKYWTQDKILETYGTSDKYKAPIRSDNDIWGKVVVDPLNIAFSTPLPNTMKIMEPFRFVPMVDYAVKDYKSKVPEDVYADQSLEQLGRPRLIPAVKQTEANLAYQLAKITDYRAKNPIPDQDTVDREFAQVERNPTEANVNAFKAKYGDYFEGGKQQVKNAQLQTDYDAALEKYNAVHNPDGSPKKSAYKDYDPNYNPTALQDYWSNKWMRDPKGGPGGITGGWIVGNEWLAKGYEKFKGDVIRFEETGIDASGADKSYVPKPVRQGMGAISRVAGGIGYLAPAALFTTALAVPAAEYVLREGGKATRYAVPGIAQTAVGMKEQLTTDPGGFAGMVVGMWGAGKFIERPPVGVKTARIPMPKGTPKVLKVPTLWGGFKQVALTDVQADLIRKGATTVETPTLGSRVGISKPVRLTPIIPETITPYVYYQKPIPYLKALTGMGPSWSGAEPIFGYTKTPNIDGKVTFSVPTQSQLLTTVAEAIETQRKTVPLTLPKGQRSVWSQETIPKGTDPTKAWWFTDFDKKRGVWNGIWLLPDEIRQLKQMEAGKIPAATPSTKPDITGSTKFWGTNKKVSEADVVSRLYQAAKRSDKTFSISDASPVLPAEWDILRDVGKKYGYEVGQVQMYNPAVPGSEVLFGKQIATVKQVKVPRSAEAISLYETWKPIGKTPTDAPIAKPATQLGRSYTKTYFTGEPTHLLSGVLQESYFPTGQSAPLIKNMILKEIAKAPTDLALRNAKAKLGLMEKTYQIGLPRYARNPSEVAKELWFSKNNPRAAVELMEIINSERAVIYGSFGEAIFQLLIGEMADADLLSRSPARTGNRLYEWMIKERTGYAKDGITPLSETRRVPISRGESFQVKTQDGKWVERVRLTIDNDKAVINAQHGNRGMRKAIEIHTPEFGGAKGELVAWGLPTEKPLTIGGSLVMSPREQMARKVSAISGLHKNPLGNWEFSSDQVYHAKNIADVSRKIENLITTTKREGVFGWMGENKVKSIKKYQADIEMQGGIQSLKKGTEKGQYVNPELLKVETTKEVPVGKVKYPDKLPKNAVSDWSGKPIPANSKISKVVHHTDYVTNKYALLTEAEHNLWHAMDEGTAAIDPAFYNKYKITAQRPMKTVITDVTPIIQERYWSYRDMQMPEVPYKRVPLTRKYYQSSAISDVIGTIKSAPVTAFNIISPWGIESGEVPNVRKSTESQTVLNKKLRQISPIKYYQASKEVGGGKSYLEGVINRILKTTDRKLPGTDTEVLGGVLKTSRTEFVGNVRRDTRNALTGKKEPVITGVYREVSGLPKSIKFNRGISEDVVSAVIEEAKQIVGGKDQNVYRRQAGALISTPYNVEIVNPVITEILRRGNVDVDIKGWKARNDLLNEPLRSRSRTVQNVYAVLTENKAVKALQALSDAKGSKADIALELTKIMRKDKKGFLGGSTAEAAQTLIRRESGDIDWTTPYHRDLSREVVKMLIKNIGDENVRITPARKTGTVIEFRLPQMSDLEGIHEVIINPKTKKPVMGNWEKAFEAHVPEFAGTNKKYIGRDAIRKRPLINIDGINVADLTELIQRKASTTGLYIDDSGKPSIRPLLGGGGGTTAVPRYQDIGGAAGLAAEQLTKTKSVTKRARIQQSIGDILGLAEPGRDVEGVAQAKFEEYITRPQYGDYTKIPFTRKWVNTEAIKNPLKAIWDIDLPTGIHMRSEPIPLSLPSELGITGMSEKDIAKHKKEIAVGVPGNIQEQIVYDIFGNRKVGSKLDTTVLYSGKHKPIATVVTETPSRVVRPDVYEPGIKGEAVSKLKSSKGTPVEIQNTVLNGRDIRYVEYGGKKLVVKIVDGIDVVDIPVKIKPGINVREGKSTIISKGWGAELTPEVETRIFGDSVDYTPPTRTTAMMQLDIMNRGAKTGTANRFAGATQEAVMNTVEIAGGMKSQVVLDVFDVLNSNDRFYINNKRTGVLNRIMKETARYDPGFELGGATALGVQQKTARGGLPGGMDIDIGTSMGKERGVRKIIMDELTKEFGSSNIRETVTEEGVAGVIQRKINNKWVEVIDVHDKSFGERTYGTKPSKPLQVTENGVQFNLVSRKRIVEDAVTAFGYMKREWVPDASLPAGGSNTGQRYTGMRKIFASKKIADGIAALLAERLKTTNPIKRAKIDKAIEGLQYIRDQTVYPQAAETARKTTLHIAEEVRSGRLKVGEKTPDILADIVGKRLNEYADATVNQLPSTYLRIPGTRKTVRAPLAADWLDIATTHHETPSSAFLPLLPGGIRNIGAILAVDVPGVSWGETTRRKVPVGKPAKAEAISYVQVKPTDQEKVWGDYLTETKPASKTKLVTPKYPKPVKAQELIPSIPNSYLKPLTYPKTAAATVQKEPKTVPSIKTYPKVKEDYSKAVVSVYTEVIGKPAYPAQKYPKKDYVQTYAKADYVAAYPKGGYKPAYPKTEYVPAKYPPAKYPKPEYPITKYKPVEYPKPKYTPLEYLPIEYLKKYPKTEYKPVEYPTTKYKPVEYPKPKYTPIEYPKPKYKPIEYPYPKYTPKLIPEPKYYPIIPKKDEYLFKRRKRRLETPMHWEFSQSAEPEDVTEFIFGSGSGLFSGTKKPKSAPAKKKAKGNKYIR